jgi:UDP-N-acetylglucosamine 1-carboxyvinyltransferase
MDRFIIEGGRPLHGTVTPAGNKNSALPLLAACLLTDEPVILRNVPQIDDVRTMRHLLSDLGAAVAELEPHTWRVQVSEVRKAALDPELCKRIRASILLAGPMLARAGHIELPPPGGDVIGRRRVDTHFLALQALGAQYEFDGGFRLQTPGLRGADVLLDEASVTATENAVMAAAIAPGRTVIRNAASEPHVQELCRLINALGGRVDNIGSNMLEIEGVPKLNGGEFTIGPDYLEVVSYIGAAAVTGGQVRIAQAGAQYLDMTRLVFSRLGVRWEVDGDDIVVPAGRHRRGHPANHRHALARLPRRPDEHRYRPGDAGQRNRPVPRVDVREPPLLRGSPDQHGRAHRLVRPAPLPGAGRGQPPG